MNKLLSFLFLFLNQVSGHGRMTFPTPRLKISDGGINAPSYTCIGPIFKSSATSMRCHDSNAGVVQSVLTAGEIVNFQMTMEAPHPGDCSIWLSYDTDFDAPLNWIKLKDIPGCLSPTGLDTISGPSTFSFVLPEFLPACDHCVLRWELYGVQQVSNVEFYINCADVQIINNINTNCAKPGPTTQINGIEHLLFNLKDPTQTGCPFYNVYDPKLRPPIDKRSRGPLEWVPRCDNGPIVPTNPPPVVIIYPCTNINCGSFGTCNNGICNCRNGYSGQKCEIPPMVTCNLNCDILNRQVCRMNNLCGACKNGFLGQDNSNAICNLACNRDCNALNRRSCIEPNVCGVCLPNFTEPLSNKRSESCAPPVNYGSLVLSVSSSWAGGFCGKWSGLCPPNRQISFIVPPEIFDLRGWNMINMQKVDNKITGFCASWARTGYITNGGFCASFQVGKRIVARTDGYFLNTNTFRHLLDYEMDENYQNVSVVMNLFGSENSTNYDMILNDIYLNLYGNRNLVLLKDTITEDGDTELYFKIICNSRQEFDSALFLHTENLGDMILDPNVFYKDPIDPQVVVNDDMKNDAPKLSWGISMIFLILVNLLLYV